MSPDSISWIIVLIVGSVVAKAGGLFLRKRDVGVVLGPLVGALGAVGLWRGLVALGIVQVTDPVGAGLAGAAGAALLYAVVAILKTGKRQA
jgi:hypothetical protein